MAQRVTASSAVVALLTGGNDPNLASMPFRLAGAWNGVVFGGHLRKASASIRQASDISPKLSTAYSEPDPMKDAEG